MTKHMKIDVVEKFAAKAAARPIPLKRTDYAVEIVGGLAAVKLTRLFRNEEKGPIEATITFPVPFEAVVSELVTKVGGRTLVGKAASKVAARQSYEDAIDRGKSAVLHEELLRGLHMVSVANVAPGAEVEVCATFAMPLSKAGDARRMRIPVTIGQVYGQIPLPESDAVLTGGPVESASISIEAGTATATLVDGELEAGKGRVPLNRPIEIEVSGIGNTPLVGRAADGRVVTLTMKPLSTSEIALDVQIVLDTSGSMNEAVTSVRHAGHLSKWDVVRKGVASAARRGLKDTDRIGLWVFSSGCREVGRATGSTLETLVRDCPFDGQGTELAGAVAKVTKSRSEANVLLVTDGKSWGEIDVQAAMETGARFTVVLVGEDSLEVNVGYLAAMSGGQMFIVGGGDADRAIEAAISSMRTVASPARPITGLPTSFARNVGGIEIVAEWREADEDAPQREGAAARLAAYAAGFALPAMEKEQAASFAEAEGIVSHLTSIILVDEEGVAVEGIPSTRKVALADPATMLMSFGSSAPTLRGARAMFSPAMLASAAPMGHARAKEGATFDTGMSWLDAQVDGEEYEDRARLRRTPRPVWPGHVLGPRTSDTGLPGSPSWTVPASPGGFIAIPNSVWDENANALSENDLSGLSADVKAIVLRVSDLTEVRSLSDALGMHSMMVAIALLARRAVGSRSAERLARSLLKGADPQLLAAAEKALS